MKLPRGDTLIWVIFLFAGGLYFFWRLPNVHPSLQLASAGIACVMCLIAILLWLKFRWAPELFLALFLYFVGWGIYRCVFDGITLVRLGIIAGGACAIFAYLSLRKEVRGDVTPDVVEPIPEGPSHADDELAEVHADARPRWVSVAMAARWARILMPLFDRVPFQISDERRDGLLNALSLVEQSAEQASPADGLKDAWYNVVMARGAVTRESSTLNDKGELTPEIETAAGVAVNVTYVVQHAIGAAMSEFPESWYETLEAYGTATDICEMANKPELKNQIDKALVLLTDMAKQSKWTDNSPVTLAVFD